MKLKIRKSVWFLTSYYIEHGDIYWDIPERQFKAALRMVCMGLKGNKRYET